VIIGADGKELRTSDLVELFDDDLCEGLKDKPKFFFIQVFSFYPLKTNNYKRFGFNLCLKQLLTIFFSYIVEVSFIGGGNRSTWRKPLTGSK
jgi:hypothetical protein